MSCGLPLCCRGRGRHGGPGGRHIWARAPLLVCEHGFFWWFDSFPQLSSTSESLEYQPTQSTCQHVAEAAAHRVWVLQY
eukprot:3779509-Prymnesium_polylepis.1